MDDGRCLAERTVHRGHACHVWMRGDNDGRRLGLELARRHVVLGRRLVVWVPLLHVHLLRVAVGWAIVLMGMKLRIRVVVDGRMCLGRRSVVLVWVLHLLPARVVWRPTRRKMAWHHGRQAAMLPRCRALVSTTKRPTCEATGTRAVAWGYVKRLIDGRRDKVGVGEARRRR